MTWLKLDDKFVRHPKVQALTDPAFRLHMAALGHCAEYATDGRVKAHVVATLTAHPDKAPLIKEMVDEGLWEAIVGGWEIHDFLQYNPSSEQIKNRRKCWRSRQESRRESRRDTPCESERESPETPGSGTGSESAPDPEGVQGEPRISECRLKSVPPPPAEEDPGLTAERVWHELWQKKYKRRYVQVGGNLQGPKSDGAILVTIGAMIRERGDPGGAEAYLRHKFAAYLNDRGHKEWLKDNCHPLRSVLNDWNKYGEPKAPQRASPPTIREELAELISIDEMARRGAEAIAAMGGKGGGG